MCAKNYQNRARCNKVVAKMIKWYSFLTHSVESTCVSGLIVSGFISRD